MSDLLGLIHDQPSSIVDFIRSVLGRVKIVPEPFDLPEGQGYVYATFCVPLTVEGCEQLGYVGSSIRDFRTYRGSGTHPDFLHAREHVPPCEWVKVCLGVYPEKNLGRMEKMVQRALGIRGEFRDDGHPPWWNKRAYGGSIRDLHADPKFAAAHAERMRRRHADPKFAAAHAERSRERMRRQRADPEFRAAYAESMRRLHADPEFAAANAESMRRLNADPEFRAANAERMRRRHADPVYAAAHAERSRERMRRQRADPKFRAAHAESMRRLHADPEFAAANAQRMRETMRRLTADPEFQAANAERMRETNRRHADPVWKSNHLADLRAAVARVLGTAPEGQT